MGAVELAVVGCSEGRPSGVCFSLLRSPLLSPAGRCTRRGQLGSLLVSAEAQPKMVPAVCGFQAWLVPDGHRQGFVTVLPCVSVASLLPASPSPCTVLTTGDSNDQAGRVGAQESAQPESHPPETHCCPALPQAPSEEMDGTGQPGLSGPQGAGQRRPSPQSCASLAVRKMDCVSQPSPAHTSGTMRAECLIDEGAPSSFFCVTTLSRKQRL